MNKDDIGKVITVLGAETPESLGITDSHNHVWIEPVPGSDPGSPVLTDQTNIRAEMIEFHQAGGGCQIDCQPGESGRNGNMLAELSLATRVKIVASTGYHLTKYYPQDHWLFSTSVDRAAEYFQNEIENGMKECLVVDRQIRAGFIKIACQSTLSASPTHLMKAAAHACKNTGCALEIHTEKGSEAAEIVEFFITHDTPPDRLVLCHMDKRPDVVLHKELAQAGVVLEYDTFFRPKYHPEKTVWPLILELCGMGMDSSIALATDLAESNLWNYINGGPGLVGFITIIRQRLAGLGLDEDMVNKMTGGNIANRLAIRDISEN